MAFPSLVGRDRPRHKAYSTGITSKVSTVENTMPPIIGAAIHFITSIPLPVVHIMGSRTGDGKSRDVMSHIVLFPSRVVRPASGAVATHFREFMSVPVTPRHSLSRVQGPRSERCRISAFVASSNWFAPSGLAILTITGDLATTDQVLADTRCAPEKIVNLLRSLRHAVWSHGLCIVLIHNLVQGE